MSAIWFPVIYEISFEKCENQPKCIIYELCNLGSLKRVHANGFLDKRGLILVRI